MAAAYGACDVVAFPSTMEGFGNPVIESAVHRRPLAVADYPVLRELASFGFRWLPAGSPPAVASWLAAPDAAWIDANAEIARHHFSLAALQDRVGALFEAQGWRP
jgi:glycosyltransferase involved in cell wall biosynthesis